EEVASANRLRKIRVGELDRMPARQRRLALAADGFFTRIGRQPIGLPAAGATYDVVHAREYCERWSIAIERGTRSRGDAERRRKALSAEWRKAAHGRAIVASYTRFTRIR